MVRKVCLVLLLSLASAWASAQDMTSVEISTTKITDSLYMLQGQGGNIGLFVGKDGVFMIDDQFAPLSDKIRAAVAEVTDKPVRFLINTHWHFDHTGGNENFGKGGSLIVAHDNVRKRMASKQFIKFFDKELPPSPKAALPVITYSDRASFHINGDTVDVFHVQHAHTDGDSLIRFNKANVLHLGDTFFNGLYPFIDLGSGGSIQGVIAAADVALSIADSKTKIIPGHGPLTDKKGLKAYRDMLVEVHDAVAKLIEQGKSRDEVIAAKPSGQYDEKLGGALIKPEPFVGFVHDSLKKPPSAVGLLVADPEASN